VEVLVLAKVHGLVVVLDDGVFPVAFDFAEKVEAQLDVAELVERLAGRRVRRLVGLLVDVNADVMFVFVMFHFCLRGLKAALVEREEIVVPVAVGVGPNIWHAACGADDADVGTLAGVRVDHEECVGLRINALDDLLARPPPARSGITQVRDVLVRTLRVEFGDAGNLYVCHAQFLSFRG
jgi:hypothetical protein